MKDFLITKGLPTGEAIKKVLQSDHVKRIVNFCLGPLGTNIGQAAEKWSKETGITDKTEIVFHDTPEACLEASKKVGDGVLGIFWTCAVYYKLNELFLTTRILPLFLLATPCHLMQCSSLLDRRE